MPPSATLLKRDVYPEFETRITPATVKHWPGVRESFIRNSSLFSNPGTFEPEYKFIIPEKAVFERIVAAIASEHLLPIGPDNLLKQKDYILLSMGMDTVDAEGNPTELFREHGYQYRQRMSYKPEIAKKSKRFENIQANMKDLLNDARGMRNEYEALVPLKDIPAGLDHGVNYLIEKYESEGKKLPSFLYDMHQHRLAVKELCMTSRAQFYIIHKMPDMQCGVIYEACADSQIYSTPRADVIAGQDYEFELEAKYITCPGCEPSEAQKLYILQTSLDRLKEIVLDVDPRICMSEESKLQRAAAAVARHHSQPLSLGIQPSQILYQKAGNLQALMQDVDDPRTLISKDWLVNTPHPHYSRY